MTVDPNYLLEFEKFVSKQKIHYFGTGVNYGMLKSIYCVNITYRSC